MDFPIVEVTIKVGITIGRKKIIIPGKRGKRLTISKKTQPTPHMSIL
jgi:hypothetical protein